MSRSCKMVFTSFKMEIDWERIYNDNSDVIRYLVCQLEESPKTGKFHYQGYIQFFKACRFARFQKLINDKCHMEIARGTTIENLEYCTKIKTSLGEVWEFGKPTSQGKRNDWNHIKDMIDDGATIQELAHKHFGDYIRYHRGFEKYKYIHDKSESQNRRSVKVKLILGPTGTGKTQGVLDKFGDDKVYILEFDKGSNVWWDGYQGEDVILLDDYNNNYNLPRLLRVLDKYKLRLPIKGGFTWAKWTKVFITTNLRKCELHESAKDEHRNALFRRIDEIDNKWVEPIAESSSVFAGAKCSGNTSRTCAIIPKIKTLDLDG